MLQKPLRRQFSKSFSILAQLIADDCGHPEHAAKIFTFLECWFDNDGVPQWLQPSGKIPKLQMDQTIVDKFQGKISS
jgi:hypothetical protein